MNIGNTDLIFQANFLSFYFPFFHRMSKLPDMTSLNNTNFTSSAHTHVLQEPSFTFGNQIAN